MPGNILVSDEKMWDESFHWRCSQFWINGTKAIQYHSFHLSRVVYSLVVPEELLVVLATLVFHCGESPVLNDHGVQKRNCESLPFSGNGNKGITYIALFKLGEEEPRVIGEWWQPWVLIEV